MHAEVRTRNTSSGHWWLFPFKAMTAFMLGIVLPLSPLYVGAKLAFIEATSETVKIQVTNAYTATDCSNNSSTGSGSNNTCGHSFRIVGIVNGGKTETFIVKDVDVLWVWNSSDIWGELATQHNGHYGTYEIDDYGLRIPFGSSFRAITNVQTVIQQP